MTGQTIGLLLVMIIYLILMVGIGVIYSKKNNDVSDFYLGGRKLGPIVTAMSAEASDGTAGCCLSFRLCRSRLDSDRTCDRYLS